MRSGLNWAEKRTVGMDGVRAVGEEATSAAAFRRPGCLIEITNRNWNPGRLTEESVRPDPEGRARAEGASEPQTCKAH